VNFLFLFKTAGSLETISQKSRPHTLLLYNYYHMGYPFRFAGAYEPTVWKHILEYQIILKWNCACTSRPSMFTHKFSERRNNFCIRCKKCNFLCSNITIRGIFFYLFYTWHIKCSFPRKHVCEHRMSRHTREILSQNFLTFWNFVCILYNRFVCTDAPKHLLRNICMIMIVVYLW
jgi:hypothetical protein